MLDIQGVVKIEIFLIFFHFSPTLFSLSSLSVLMCVQSWYNYGSCSDGIDGIDAGGSHLTEHIADSMDDRKLVGFVIIIRDWRDWI